MLSKSQGFVALDGESLTLEQVIEVARKGMRAELSAEARIKVETARTYVERLIEEDRVAYGITTGFGKFSDVVISREDSQTLQRNLIMSHATGVGEPLSEEVVRAIMLLRANALAKGYSGIRVATLEHLLAVLNSGIVPVIPEKGSLGASGDLAPLAHLVLVLMGEGEAFYQGQRVSGKVALAKAGLSPITLEGKEGLALINGTQVMTAIAALAVIDAETLCQAADIAGALSLEALEGIPDAFDAKVHALRPHEGQIKVAENLRQLLGGSAMIAQPQARPRVQDAYTLRCIPQVHGPSKDAIQYVRKVVDTELNAATDNPLIFADEDQVISGGNFHGQPLALGMDFLGIAVAELANIAERRIERLVNPALSGLPAFLTSNGGLNSGLMIVQYSAAALVSENKVLAHPASVDSIPSSANQEDHVSMGTIAARKARSIIENVTHVLAMEFIAACQAIDLRRTDAELRLGTGTDIAYKVIRAQVPRLDEDRILYPDINKIRGLVASGELVQQVKERMNSLN